MTSSLHTLLVAASLVIPVTDVAPSTHAVRVELYMQKRANFLVLVHDLYNALACGVFKSEIEFIGLYRAAVGELAAINRPGTAWPPDDIRLGRDVIASAERGRSESCDLWADPRRALALQLAAEALR